MGRSKITIVILTLFFIFISSCEKAPLNEFVTDGQKKSGTPELISFDKWGYNWNAHQFVGNVFNAMIGDHINNGEFFYKIDPYLGDDETYLAKYPWAKDLPFWVYRNMELVMHWNDALINSEGVYLPWLDSHAWITFHYRMGSGKDKWFVRQKFVAAKSTDELINGLWYSESGDFLGWYYSYPDLILIEWHETGTPPVMVGPMGPGTGKYKKR